MVTETYQIGLAVPDISSIQVCRISAATLYSIMWPQTGLRPDV